MILIRSFLFAVTLLAMLALPGVSVLAADFPYDPTRAKQGLHENDQEALERFYEEEAQKRHETIARYYEEEGKKNQAKTQELKRLLEHYEEKSYLYGKKAQDLQAHTDALLRKHTEAARMDAAEAASHRQIALKLKEKIDSTPRIQKVSVIEKPAHRQSGH